MPACTPFPTFRFAKQDVNFVLAEIVSCVGVGRCPPGHTLAPAYLMVMLAEYSASNFDQRFTKDVLMKMTSVIEDAVWVSVVLC